MSWLGERRRILAVDTETTGLQWWTPGFTRLVQFGDAETGWAMAADEWRGLARQALTVYEGATCAHNLKFDQHALASDGLPLLDWRKAHDPMVMHHLNHPDRSHALKTIAAKRWGQQAVVGQAVLKMAMRTNGWNWATVPVDHPAYWAYGAFDTVLAARVAEEEMDKLVDAGLLDAYERELSVQRVLWRAERRGMRVDPVYTELLRNQWLIEAAALKDELQAAGIENPNSNKQIEAALKELGWEPDEFTPTGNAKLDGPVLLGLYHIFGDLAPKIVRFKRLVKWDASYLVPFLNNRDANDRIHASIKTLAARTGRMSVTGPALQTLPSDEASIRRCILPYEGEVLYAIDYSGQEARIFASYADEQAMLDIIREGGDLYTFIAQSVYGRPEITKADPERGVSKTVFLAGIYGAGEEKQALTAGVTRPEIQAFRSRYKATFPNAANFSKQVEQVGLSRLASEGRAYITTAGGRHAVADSDKLYALTNYLCQGSGADVLKRAIVELDAAGFGDRIVLPVHDELLLSLPEGDEGADEARAIADIMEDHTSFQVPIATETTGPLPNWGHKYGKG